MKEVMKKYYHLNILCVNGDNYEFYLENKEEIKNLLNLNDHEGSCVIVHELTDITSEYIK